MLKPDKLRTSFLAVPPDRKETSPGAPDLASELAALKAAKGAAPAAPGLAGDLAALLAKKREKREPGSGSCRGSFAYREASETICAN